MSGPNEGSKDATIAVSAASRVATARARAGGQRADKRKRSGSLALTALITVFVLVGMLVLMLKVAS